MEKYMEKIRASKYDHEKKNNSNYNEEKDQLPGFRFHPTDRELVGFYLKRKVENKPIKFDLIKHVDVYQYEPWDLPRGDEQMKELYYFCKRGRKYKNSIRPNRVSANGHGFWKATGIDKPIYNNNNDNDYMKNTIGLKKSLVYYRGSAGKGTKTEWMMHEYRLPQSPSSTNDQEAEVWTLCRIFKRDMPYKKYNTSLDWRKKLTTQQSFSDSTNNSVITSSTIDHNNMDKNSTNYNNNYDFYANHNYQNPIRGDVNWDELRPVVDLALDQPVPYYLI